MERATVEQTSPPSRRVSAAKITELTADGIAATSITTARFIPIQPRNPYYRRPKPQPRGNTYGSTEMVLDERCLHLSSGDARRSRPAVGSSESSVTSRFQTYGRTQESRNFLAHHNRNLESHTIS